MEVIFMQIFGALSFLIGTLVIGKHIRQNPTKQNAERLSRISHTLFWCGLVLPEFVGIFYPGLSSFDSLLGISSFSSFWVQVVGVVMILVGTYYLAVSNIALKLKGSGFAAFKLTKQVVLAQIYSHTRNPMSLGTYLFYVGVAMVVGSSYLLFGALLLIIPVHIFNLLYFEEYELAARHGKSYEQYKENTPFMIPKFV